MVHISSSMNLTKHEKGVIVCLLENSRKADREIAEQLGITSQAVGKIRKKLEKNGVIKGYGVKLNYDALGIKAFAIILAKLTPEGWNYKGGIGVQEKISANPNIINIYRVPEGQITHIFFCAFRNIEELDKYMHILQSQYSDYLTINKTYVLSNSSIIKDSIEGIVEKMLNEYERERMPEPILFGKMIGEDE